jgi:hypothetical protein
VTGCDVGREVVDGLIVESRRREDGCGWSKFLYEIPERARETKSTTF